MSQERWLRGEHDGRERPLDWRTLAQRYDIAADQARPLYEEARRRASAYRGARQHEEAIYLELLTAAREEASRPSPGKVTSTMRCASTMRRRSHTSSLTGQRIAPGKRTLTSYLGQPGGQRRNHGEARERELLEAIRDAFGRMWHVDDLDPEDARSRSPEVASRRVEAAWAIASGNLDELDAPDRAPFTAKAAPVEDSPSTAGSRAGAAPQVRSTWERTMNPWMGVARYGTPVPGPVGQTAVQAKGNADTGDPERVHRAATAGVAGSGGPLPYLEQIQESFGTGHDLSGVRAHIGGAATGASDTMGAEAYARGEDVAFRGQPDLHTVAHEAAHVVQQRAGVQLESGVGRAGDAYEAIADAVADRVVARRSAADLLAPFAPATSPVHAAPAPALAPCQCGGTCERCVGSNASPAPAPVTASPVVQKRATVGPSRPPENDGQTSSRPGRRSSRGPAGESGQGDACEGAQHTVRLDHEPDDAELLRIIEGLVGVSGLRLEPGARGTGRALAPSGDVFGYYVIPPAAEGAECFVLISEGCTFSTAREPVDIEDLLDERSTPPQGGGGGDEPGPAMSMESGQGQEGTAMTGGDDAAAARAMDEAGGTTRSQAEQLAQAAEHMGTEGAAMHDREAAQLGGGGEQEGADAVGAAGEASRALGQGASQGAAEMREVGSQASTEAQAHGGAAGQRSEEATDGDDAEGPAGSQPGGSAAGDVPPESTAARQEGEEAQQVLAGVEGALQETRSDAEGARESASGPPREAWGAEQEGDNWLPRTWLGWLMAIGDLVSDFLPVVDTIKDVLTLISGRNPVTGERVSWFWRIIAFLGPLVVMFKAIARVIKAVAKVIAEGASRLRRAWDGIRAWLRRRRAGRAADEAADGASDGGRAADEAADGAGDGGRAADEAADGARRSTPNPHLEAEISRVATRDPDFPQAVEGFVRQYPDPVDLPDNTPLFRWASREHGIGEAGRSFWQTGRENMGHIQRYLFATDLGALRRAGVVREDPAELVGDSMSVVAQHAGDLAHLPGRRYEVVGFMPPNTPVFREPNPFGWPTVDDVPRRWQDHDGNMHFPNDD